MQLLLGHTKLESTVRYLGIEVDDAHEIAEQTEILCRKFSVSVPIEGRFLANIETVVRVDQYSFESPMYAIKPPLG